ncbi:MAG: hypothetical protein J5612_06330 [Paludibacteraceae bacterium]|nr:hypothetical protein [Paludibacteraceae bacterium]
MKRVPLLIILCLVSLCVSAEEDKFKDLLTNYGELGGLSKITAEHNPYYRFELADSAVIEYFIKDNITVAYTVCAPVCSSCVRVYNKDWVLISTIKPPFTSVFPLATIDQETGQINWTDNDDWKY